MNSDVPDVLTQPLQEAEQALQKALRELSGILNTAVMGITLLRHRKIDRCNRRMEELFGFGEGQMTAHALAAGLVGAVVKDPVQDRIVWLEYLETVLKDRVGWKDLYRACREIV